MVLTGTRMASAVSFRKDVHFDGVSDSFHGSHLVSGWLFNLTKNENILSGLRPRQKGFLLHFIGSFQSFLSLSAL
jgi:hypothetical protein